MKKAETQFELPFLFPCNFHYSSCFFLKPEFSIPILIRTIRITVCAFKQKKKKNCRYSVCSLEKRRFYGINSRKDESKRNVTIRFDWFCFYQGSNTHLKKALLMIRCKTRCFFKKNYTLHVVNKIVIVSILDIWLIDSISCHLALFDVKFAVCFFSTYRRSTYTNLDVEIKLVISIKIIKLRFWVLLHGIWNGAREQNWNRIFQWNTCSNSLIESLWIACFTPPSFCHFDLMD